MTTPHTTILAALAAITEREQRATPGPFYEPEDIREIVASMEDVPRLVAAVKVLAEALQSTATTLPNGRSSDALSRAASILSEQ